MTFSATDTQCVEDYTQEQLELVNRTLSCSTRMYYDILGLPQSSLTDDVKKQYRNLCRKLHPDKNKAPGAEDAFKMIYRAYIILSDEEQKRHYDTVELPILLSEVRRRKFQKPYSEMYKPQKRTYQYSNSGADIQERNHYGWAIFCLFGLPIIIMWTFPVWSYIFSSEEYFRLTRSGEFTEQRLTSYGRIPYFVKEGFSVNNIKDLYELEDHVEKKLARKTQWLKEKYGYTYTIV